MPEGNKKCVYEVSLRDNLRPATSLILKNIFINAGVNPADIVEYSDGFSCRASVYFTSTFKAKKTAHALQNLRLKGIAIRLKKLQKHQWENKGKESFKPYRLSKAIEVAPISCRRRGRSGNRHRIFLETAGAFGSGLHETTKFIAQFVGRYGRRAESFFDIGTGTGILSLIALRCGVRQVYAVDIDKNTVTTAKRNFTVNGYSAGLVKCQDIRKIRGRRRYAFDFVAANLITRELINTRKNILSFVKPGGFLAASGISLENFSFFKKAFATLPLRAVKVKKGKEWVAVLYRRIE